MPMFSGDFHTVGTSLKMWSGLLLLREQKSCGDVYYLSFLAMFDKRWRQAIMQNVMLPLLVNVAKTCICLWL